MGGLGFNMIESGAQARFNQAEGQLKNLEKGFQNPSDPEHKKLKKGAQEFEAVFFKQIIEQMDKTVERGDFLNGGSGEEMFRSMMFDEVAKRMSERPGGSGLGLAEMIYKQTASQLNPVTAQPNTENKPFKIQEPGISIQSKSGLNPLKPGRKP
ncbi:MAG: rod-binding protein [Cyanobacteria bacterium]|nr:rod-binding protein [Cyanobacteriota bacterium]